MTSAMLPRTGRLGDLIEEYYMQMHQRPVEIFIDSFKTRLQLIILKRSIGCFISN